MKMPALNARLADLWAFLGHESTARVVGLMAAFSGLGQLAILATLPLVTRLYDPAAFGLHAMIISFVGMASVGACLCLELAIVSAPSDSQADELFAGALMSIPLTTLASGLVFASLIYFDLFSYGQLPLWCIPLAMLLLALNGLYVASRHRTLRHNAFTAIAKATLVQNIGRALVPVALFPLAPFWLGLTGGELGGRAIGLRGLLLLVWPNRLSAVWRRPRPWIALVRREYRYTAVLLVTVLVDASASMLIAPLIAGTYGAEAAGEYFLVTMAMGAPFALLGTAVADVLHVRGASLYRSNPVALPAFTRSTALALLLLGMAIYLPVYALAPSVFPQIFGPKWIHVAQVTQAMTPFIVVGFMASPCSRLLLAVNRTTLKVWSDALRLVGVPLTIYLSHSTGATFLQAMWNLSWFLAFAYLVYFLLTYAAVLLRTSEAIASAEKNQ